jgi:hypothetical protein
MDKLKYLTFERLLADEVNQLLSLINEVDFVVDFTAAEPRRESAEERAARLWFKQAPRRTDG